jgi:hypothetical protein
VYLVSYTAFSVPAVIAGLAVTHYALRDTATVYAAVVVVLALTAALATELTLGASRRGTPAATATGGARQPINPPEGAHQERAPTSRGRRVPPAASGDG